MPGLAGHGKPLAIRGGEHPAPPGLTEWEMIVIVDEGDDRRLEGILAEIPRGAPGQVVIGQVTQGGHLLHAEIAGMREHAGLEVG